MKRNRAPAGQVVLTQKGTKNTSLGLTLPSSTGRAINHLVGHHFACILTDEGILFKYVGPPDQDSLPILQDVPAWAQEEKES